MLVGKNDLISIVYDEKEDRVIFFDSDNNYITDWSCEIFKSKKECFLESLKLLILDEKELVNFYADCVGYKTEAHITPTEKEFKIIKNEFGNEAINRFGNSYLCLYL